MLHTTKYGYIHSKHCLENVQIYSIAVAQAEEIVHFQEHGKLKVWYEYKTKSDYFNLGALKEVYHSSFFTDVSPWDSGAESVKSWSDLFQKLMT